MNNTCKLSYTPMRVLSIFLVTISLLGLLLPIFRASYWWLRVFDYPQLQIVILSIFSLGFLFTIWGYDSKVTIILSVMLVGALIYRIPKILKYTPLTKVNAKLATTEGSHCFRIMQSNVKMENRDSDKVRELVKKYHPDILLIVEPDKWWSEQLSELDILYEHSIKQPQENTYGMILYSKFPLKKTEINFLVKEDTPSFFTIVELPDGKEFDLHCLHPEPPKPGTDTYDRDAELLLVGKRIKKTNRPAIVVGDLNDVAWSYTSELFQRYSDLLDPREGRGFFNTYNAYIPFFRYPLDHFFYSEEFGLSQLRKLDAIGSDHFPMMMDICLEHNRDHSENQEPVDSEDIQNVEEKIQDGNTK